MCVFWDVQHFLQSVQLKQSLISLTEIWRLNDSFWKINFALFVLVNVSSVKLFIIFYFQIIFVKLRLINKIQTFAQNSMFVHRARLSAEAIFFTLLLKNLKMNVTVINSYVQKMTCELWAFYLAYNFKIAAEILVDL